MIHFGIGYAIKEGIVSSIRIGYGLKNGELVHVSQVESGLKCGCLCPACKAKLVARKGDERAHHFAHANASACTSASETALHLLAKEIFTELPSIALPAYIYSKRKILPDGKPFSYEEKLLESTRVRIDSVEIEPNRGRYRPDIVISCSGRELCIEIAVTHRSDKQKRRILRKHDAPTIEILLRDEDGFLKREELKKVLQDRIENKYWLYHPKEIQAFGNFVSGFRELRSKTTRNRVRNIQANRKPISKSDTRLYPGLDPSVRTDSLFRFIRTFERCERTKKRLPGSFEVECFFPEADIYKYRNLIMRWKSRRKTKSQ